MVRFACIGSVVASWSLASAVLAGGGGSFAWYSVDELQGNSGESLSASGVTLSATAGGVGASVVVDTIGVGVEDAVIGTGERVIIDFDRAVLDPFISFSYIHDTDGDLEAGEVMVEAFDSAGVSFGAETVTAVVGVVDLVPLYGNKHISRIAIEGVGDDLSIGTVAGFDNWFVPGDALVVQTDDPSDRAYSAMFDSFPGLSISVVVPELLSGPSLTVRFWDVHSSTPQTTTITSPSDKQNLKFDCSETGVCRLEIESSAASAFPTTIQTKRKLGGTFKNHEYKAQALVGDHTYSFDAVAGSELDAQLVGNKHFTGPMTLTILDPSESPLDLALGGGGGAGKLKVSDQPLSSTGTYTVLVGGFGGGVKEKVSVEIKVSPGKTTGDSSTMH